MKTCCKYSEAPRRCSSNEHPQCMFLWRNRKKYTWCPLLSCTVKFFQKVTVHFIQIVSKGDIVETILVIKHSSSLSKFETIRIASRESGILTLVLLNSDRSCHCKQCKYRSVGFWRSQLILDLHCLSVSMWICIDNFDQVIWVAEN